VGRGVISLRCTTSNGGCSYIPSFLGGLVYQFAPATSEKVSQLGNTINYSAWSPPWYTPGPSTMPLRTPVAGLVLHSSCAWAGHFGLDRPYTVQCFNLGLLQTAGDRANKLYLIRDSLILATAKPVRTTSRLPPMTFCS
jgi:hypothetical protein